MDEINFVEKYITNTPCNVNSEIYKEYKRNIYHFQGQAIYIYSFKKRKMVYAIGWEELLGYKNEEINLYDLITLTTPRYADFARKFYEKSLMFISTKTKELEKYCITVHIEKVHKNGSHIPFFSKVGVYRASSEGEVEEIIGVFETIKTLKHGEIMQYETYGPDVNELDESLSKELVNHINISGKEKEVLILAAKGLTFKEIAHYLSISQSAVEKRILPLYKRFNVKSLPHLIDFSHNNHIL